ncbi:GNAT family N-acetyltransferase [Mumia zhuanghuii]|uniref:GNAT family N-acetyltransferase n=1 Tax=Mumia zhuanghuii TaxID=2585211 RepID=A0A5Q6S4X7_9ACTN|nr:GNAT family N-acetyltransferase [Mumia zhuanghuii]
MSVPLGGGYLLRRAQVSDAEALAAACVRNRAHLAPWEPARDDDYYTVDEQKRRLVLRDASDSLGTSITTLIVDGAEVVGSVNVNDIVLGAFHNGHLGYWIDGRHTGHGLMTRAVDAVCTHAAELGLHRLQAATLLHNAPSQAVLRRAGFTAIGVAEAYLRIDGRWQDHVLFQRILEPVAT